jgi:hypothetical protein
VGFIDPHGDVAEELLDCIPSHRTDDVAYFNPADLEYPVGLNPLQKTHRDMHHLVVDSIIATLKSIWGDVWGTGRMQYVMHHTLSATLLGVNRLLSDLTTLAEKDGVKVHDVLWIEARLAEPRVTGKLALLHLRPAVPEVSRASPLARKMRRVTAGCRADPTLDLFGADAAAPSVPPTTRSPGRR